MAEWIPSFASGSIPVKEVKGSHKESHNAINSNPSYHARLEVPWASRNDAISALLGTPESWPKTPLMSNVVCVSAELVNDNGGYSYDDEIIIYSQYALIDCVYMPRIGAYVVDANGEDVYWLDEDSPRIESKPMNHQNLIWGDTTEAGVPNDKIQLSPEEAPPRYEPGDSLVHTIEGWTIDYDDIDTLIGTVHSEPYFSPVTGKTYAADTLMLRNYGATRGFSFRSYRDGQPTVTLKLYYEFKGTGWNRFWRIDLKNKTEDYYYIRQNVDPYNRVDPFPAADHTKYLGWIP